MVKPSYRTDSFCMYDKGYQQALDDFAINDLLSCLKKFSGANDIDGDTAWMNLTESEIESLAAILIRQLTTNLKDKAIAGYLNAIRHGSTNLPPNLLHLTFPPPSTDLPANFPDVQTPRFLSLFCHSPKTFVISKC